MADPEVALYDYDAAEGRQYGKSFKILSFAKLVSYLFTLQQNPFEPLQQSVYPKIGKNL